MQIVEVIASLHFFFSFCRMFKKKRVLNEGQTDVFHVLINNTYLSVLDISFFLLHTAINIQCKYDQFKKKG